MTDPRTDHLLDELSVVGDEHADLAGRAYLRIKVLEAAAHPGVHLGDEGLDVERLARAMRNVGFIRPDKNFENDLADVAAEYARLSEGDSR